jgi:hypothetical protein
MNRAILPLILLCLAAGCTQFPALDRTLTPELQDADYPELVPLGPVLASAQRSGADPARQNTAIDSRVAALQARAARLRGSVLNGAERVRLEEGLR